MNSPQENLKQLREKIDEACKRAGRRSEDVKLLAVSKTKPLSDIIDAYNGGQRLFGENYVQEYAKKVEDIRATGKCDDIEWHYIGSLQTNKVKYIVGLTALIHTVDRAKLAGEIEKRAAAKGIVQPVLVEVNVGGEASKSGATADGMFELLEDIAKLERLRCDGLMTMPPFLPPEEARPYFEEMARLKEKAVERGLLEKNAHLSMGMSGDFEPAIDCGATIIRIGTAIFGPRSCKYQ